MPVKAINIFCKYELIYTQNWLVDSCRNTVCMLNYTVVMVILVTSLALVEHVV